MKTTFKYIGSVILTLALGACNLDQYPYSETAADEYVTNAEAVNNLVIGTYNGLHDVMYYEWAVTELRSDNTRMRANGSTSQDTKLIEQLDQGGVTTAHTWVEDYWNACYAAIDRANKVISYVDVVDDPTLRAQYEGEAMFLRAHLYFNLVRLWGPVFLVTKKTGADEARYMQRSPVEEIYALIEGDLNAIIDNNMLPEQSAAADLGRATMPAAKGLLAKVYMTRYEVGSENYMKAGDLLRDVLASAGNPQSGADLVPYDQIFSIDNEMNKEIIFALYYNKTNDNGHGYWYSANTNVMADIRNPTPEFKAIYEEKDNRLALINTYTQVSSNLYAMTKWYDTYDATYTTQVGNDFPHLRYADVVLMYAEALAESGDGLDKALEWLNKTRTRAGLDELTTDDVTSLEEFRQELADERGREFALEGHRWFDLVRLGLAVDYFRERGYTLDAHNLIFPIPQSQIEIVNDESILWQNPGF